VREVCALRSRWLTRRIEKKRDSCAVIVKPGRGSRDSTILIE
jgi:hypothetical protein